MTARPRLYFYCQHAVGLGHLARSLALADGLGRHFDVLLVNGGRLPAGTRVPGGVELVNLPALGHDEAFDLVSHEPGVTVDEIVAARPGLLLDALHQQRPDVVLVELFPFGRKKFRFELLPLLDAVAAMGGDRPLVACSLRDILVGSRRDQAGHDDTASRRANAYLDAVLVHADPAFARLDESFHPATPLTVPVHYTGFVAPEPPPPMAAPAPASADAPAARERRVIVSAGGGSVGGPLVRAAVAAAPRLWREAGLATTVVTGPFAPDDVFDEAATAAVTTPGLTVLRQVDDLCREIRASVVTVSQCGYNTAMDILRAGTPAVVVPYAEGREDEQRRRTERLERLGVLRGVDPADLSGDTLAAAVLERLTAPVPPVQLDLEGRHRTATILLDLLAAHRARSAAKRGPRGRAGNGGGRGRGRPVSAWLDPVRDALAMLTAEGRTVRVFVRDDDGGWDAPALDRLLDVTSRHPFVVDVAVIPEIAAEALGLQRWIAAGAARVHQHGWAHVDHGTETRKCEFGDGRPSTDIARDVAQGRGAMIAAFGADAQPIFTPPWNRCSRATAQQLLAVGIQVLSRDATAEPMALPGLAEVAVSFDWSAKAKGVPIDAAERGRRLASQLLERPVVGVMLHHAVLDADQLDDVEELLATLAASPAVVATTIADEARLSLAARI